MRGVVPRLKGPACRALALGELFAKIARLLPRHIHRREFAEVRALLRPFLGGFLRPRIVGLAHQRLVLRAGRLGLCEPERFRDRHLRLRAYARHRVGVAPRFARRTAHVESARANRHQLDAKIGWCFWLRRKCGHRQHRGEEQTGQRCAAHVSGSSRARLFHSRRRAWRRSLFQTRCKAGGG